MCCMAYYSSSPFDHSTGQLFLICSIIGDKICKMLDDQLVQHIAEHGTTHPMSTDQPSDDEHIPFAPARKAPAQPKQKAGNPDVIILTIYSINLSDHCLPAHINNKHLYFNIDKPIPMKLGAVAVYDLRICMKEDIPGPNYVKGEDK